MLTTSIPGREKSRTPIEEDVPWSSACINVPWDLYLTTGNKEIIKKQYPSMKGFLQWCQDTDNPDFTTDKDCWGDHTSVIQATVNKRLLATAFYYLSATRLSTMAGELGYVSDAASFASLADSIKTAFNTNFLHENAYYGSGQQTQQALALALGLCPDSARDAVLKHLVKDIVDRDTLMTVGILGTYALFDALCDNGRSDIAFSLANQTGFPSWGISSDRVRPTMWEFWDGAGSHNHPFLGGCLPRFFYERLAGIFPTAPGYRQFAVKPTVVGDLRYVRAVIPTVRGNVVSHWKRGDGGKFVMTVAIPVNSQAEIFVPVLGGTVSTLVIKEGTKTIWRHGRPATVSKDIVYDRAEKDYIVFRAGSGTYTISSSPD